MKRDVIDQWKLDLVDPLFPKFNMDFEIIEHAKREYEGDAALFLAYRHASNPDLKIWMLHKRSYEIITEFTDIPLKDARALVNPPDGDNVDYTYIKVGSFIQVLDLYLDSGLVTWPTHFLVKSRRKSKIVSKAA